MTPRKFKLHELNSLQYLDWELEHEIEKPRCRNNKGKRKDGRTTNGGANENISLMRTFAKSQRQMLRDFAEIKQLLKELVEKLDVETKDEIKKKFEDLDYRLEEVEEQL